MNVKCTLGTDLSYEEYMNVINEAFGFTNGEREFSGLLPKLYRPGRRPQDENTVVTEDGRCVAAVGAYSHEINVCGTTLRCRGIGNVAVLNEARHRGYMKDCMNLALDMMVEDGIDLSTLGGRRQRYNYFSYERAGTAHGFALNRDNMHHIFGDDRKPAFDTVVEVGPDDEALLAPIRALSASGSFFPVRADRDFHDIALTWHAKLWAVKNGDDFIGYMIVESGSFVTEARCVRDEDFLPMLVTAFDAWGLSEMHIQLSDHMVPYLEQLAPVAEGMQTGSNMMYSVLNYARVTDAFLRLKATYTALPDGRLSLLIHGRAGDERLCLSVTDGVPSVTVIPDTEPVDRELSHLEAIRLLFSAFEPSRRTLPAHARDWLPLPIWMYRADEV